MCRSRRQSHAFRLFLDHPQARYREARHLIRLVIVDDNPMVLGGLRALFEAASDFTVAGEGSNGLEGIVAARDNEADVVLMDLSMPKMDGIEACRRIATETPAVRVVVYTALGGDERTAAAMAAGAADFLSKDLPPSELVNRVRSIALGGAVTPPASADGAGRPTVPPPLPAPARSRTRRARGEVRSPRGAGDATPGGSPGGRRAAAAGGHGQSPTVGILAPLLAGPYMTDLMAGVAAAADRARVRLVAIQTMDPGGAWSTEHPLPEVATRVPTHVLHVSSDRVGGYLTVLNAAEPTFLATLAAAGKPVVVMADDIQGFGGPTVRVDNRTGVLQAVAHLVEHGHRRIAFAGYLGQGDIRERLAAYREALVANGIDPDDSLVYPSSDNLESGGEMAASSMLLAGMPSTAVVVGTDFNAIGIMKVLSDAGLTLPRDQAVVGFDDVAAGSSIHPTLSTVHQSPREIGRVALELLLAMIGGAAVRPGRHVVSTVFIPRESCGCGQAAAVARLAVDETLASMTPEARFRHRLERLLTGPDPLSPAVRESLDRAAELTLRMAGTARVCQQPTSADLRQGSLALLAVTPHWTTITSVEACLQEYWGDITRGPGIDGRALGSFERFMRDLVVELSRCLSEIEGHARTSLQMQRDAEHDVSTSIIRGSVDDPSSLDWLAFTTARAGCLGLWTDPTPMRATSSRHLRIAGSFLKDGGRMTLPGQVSLESFPPDVLVRQRRPGEIVAVVPVKTTSMDLGLLAVVTPIVGAELSTRDRLFDKGALLGMSLEREITTERLRRSNADLATYSHAMAHDLRNPLATILMWASVAPSTAGPDDRAEPVLQTVDRIRDVAAYANDLIAHLLRYAELDRSPAPAEPVDLDLVVSKAVAALESVVRESRAVIQYRDLPAVIADAAGLEVVMENLISNAITYRRDAPPRVVIEAVATDGAWEIRCHDNGSGIPEDVREEIFQPFVRGDPAISGSGLGLATCRRIIERLGGRIWIADSTEAGTSIAFTLPFEFQEMVPDLAGPGPAGPLRD
jgi:DNA-binding LacI/PurR family transcriptional regulator/signal transduction histidine kinase/DNA-binding NarL/FixJ family response regulator